MNKKHHLGNIQNLEDLQKEIRKVNGRIKQHELELKSRWERLPQESIKATLGAVIPLFLRNKVAGGTWTFLKAAVSMFIGSKTKVADPLPGNWKSFLLGNAKQLGIYAVLKGALNLVKKRSS